MSVGRQVVDLLKINLKQYFQLSVEFSNHDFFGCLAIMEGINKYSTQRGKQNGDVLKEESCFDVIMM